MKKSLLTLLPFLAIALAGCNNNSATSDSSSTTKSTTSTPVINVDYGTLESPLTVAKFKEEAAKLGLDSENFSDEHFFVKGIIKTVPTKSSSTAYNIFQLVDNKTDTSYINVGGAILGDSVSAIYQNDEVVIEGLAENFEGYYSLYYLKVDSGYDRPTVHSVKAGTSSVTTNIKSSEVTITGLETSYTNGETASFTVEPASGLKINDVSSSLNGSLSEIDGEYSFVVQGDTVITVTTIDSSINTKKVTFDFKTISASETLNKETGLDGEIHSFTNNGLTIDTKYCYFYSKTLFLSNAGDNIVTANNTLGTIYSIKVTIGDGAANAAKYKLSVSTEPIVDVDVDEAVNKKAGETLTYEAKDGDTNKYFSICCDTSSNGRIGTVEVTYIVE